MAKKPARTIRDLRVAARDGDSRAARALLRYCGKDELAREIRRGMPPYTPRVRKMLDALTCDLDSEWEADLADLWENPSRFSRFNEENLE